MNVSSKERPAEISVQSGKNTMSLYGLFVYQDFLAGRDSAEAFLRAFQGGTARFDDCIGSYRAVLCREDGSRVYFCDNSGAMCFFYREDTAEFSDTLAAAMPKEHRRPDYAAIAQFLYFGCIYGMETIVEGVLRSDPDCYYQVENGRITKKNKGLTPLEDLPADENALEAYMRRMTRATAADGKPGCVITGGTDSRAILSHLEHGGIHPALSITGSEEQADVRIARTLAGLLGEELTVISDAPEGENWLDEAIAAADGMTGACGIYRLYKKARSLRGRGISVEYGGGAGELYKNSFINQDFPLYGGKPRWERFLKFKVVTYDFPRALCGANLAGEMDKVPEILMERLRQAAGKNKANAYLAAGYRVLQARAITGANMNARWYFPCNPLLERDVAALAFHQKPYALEMQAYQRKQVTAFCPCIKNVETDRGLTCNSGRKTAEWVKSMLFLVGVAMERILHRGRASQRVDSCFAQGLSSPQFAAALETCRNLGVLSPEAGAEQIPQGIADRLLTVGSFFENC